MADSKERDLQPESTDEKTESGHERMKADTAEWNAEEEYAAEVAPPMKGSTAARRPSEVGGEEAGSGEIFSENRIMGWFSLILAVASLFFWPVALGPLAVLFGFIAWSQGSRTLGIWSIVMGIISFLAFIAIAPMYS